MLTIEQIIKIHDSGVTVNFSDETSEMKGCYDPSTTKITIFSNSLNSEKDYHITLLHEFIHAKDDLFYDNKEINDHLSGVVSNNPYNGNKSFYERDTEKESLTVYNNMSYILAFIKKIYELDLYCEK